MQSFGAVTLECRRVEIDVYHVVVHMIKRAFFSNLNTVVRANIPSLQMILYAPIETTNRVGN